MNTLIGSSQEHTTINKSDLIEALAGKEGLKNNKASIMKRGM